MKFLLLIAMLFVLPNAAAQQSDAKPEEWLCLMPCKSGLTAKVRRVSAVETRRAHQLNMIGFTSWELGFDKPTDILPVREGEVVDADPELQRVVVRHEDGTLARYNLVDDIAVVNGQQLTLQTTIGRTSQVDAKTWAVGLEILRIEPNPNRDERRSVNARYTNLEHYIDPVFRSSRGKHMFTDGGSYKSVRRKWFVFWI